jgi:hypothetical protein
MVGTWSEEEEGGAAAADGGKWGKMCAAGRVYDDLASGGRGVVGLMGWAVLVG